MTKDEIIEMAVKAGAIPIHKNYAQRALVGNKNIERFAALVAEKERNRCSQLAIKCSWEVVGSENALRVAALDEAIRARKP